MDTNELHKLIRQGESMTLEFKGEAKAALNDRDLVEAVVCLANAEGGIVLVGIEDDGRVTGARPRHGRATDPAKVRLLIRSRTMPGLECEPTIQEVDSPPDPHGYAHSMLILCTPQRELPTFWKIASNCR